VNHYLTSAAKMSASRGVGFSLDEGIDRIGVDPLRHALCALNPETADVEFTWEQAHALTRTGLLGAIANPVYRVASLLWKRFGGRAHPAAWPEAVDERKGGRSRAGGDRLRHSGRRASSSARRR
jgi:methionyl-tRNA synthetase